MHGCPYRINERDTRDANIQRGLFHSGVLQPTPNARARPLQTAAVACPGPSRRPLLCGAASSFPGNRRAAKPNPSLKPNRSGGLRTARGQQGGGTGSESFTKFDLSKMRLLQHGQYLGQQNRCPTCPSGRRRSRLSRFRHSRPVVSCFTAEAGIRRDYKSFPNC